MTASTTPSPAPLAPGDTLDRYELLCPIAEGGMASVWVARLHGRYGFEKLFALKTILPRHAGSRSFREMFLDEARILSRVNHPNVAQMFDLGEARGILYLVMEYVDGDSLSKLSRTCQKKGVQVPTGVLLRALADACVGLHEAHELSDGAGKLLGVVHRDVSPHNILVSTRGIIKLIDFGIAKTESHVDPDAQPGVLKGKIHYMAPEQALSRPIDRRADVWAVGATLYHLLTGKAPYEGDNQLATLHLLEAGLPPPQLAPEVHPALAAVVRKALAHEPAKRYATAAELRDALERAMLVAQLTATSNDVAAFSARHLAERAKRRRDAIDQARAAVVERARMQGARAAAALTVEAVVKPAPLVSEPPPDARSFATLGSATVDAGRGLAEASPRARPSAFTVLSFMLGFAIVMGASVLAVHPKRLFGAAHAAAASNANSLAVLPASALPPPRVPPSSSVLSSLPNATPSVVPTQAPPRVGAER